jgi:hypothetical protein
MGPANQSPKNLRDPNFSVDSVSVLKHRLDTLIQNIKCGKALFVPVPKGKSTQALVRPVKEWPSGFCFPSSMTSIDSKKAVLSIFGTLYKLIGSKSSAIPLPAMVSVCTSYVGNVDMSGVSKQYSEFRTRYASMVREARGKRVPSKQGTSRKRSRPATQSTAPPDPILEHPRRERPVVSYDDSSEDSNLHEYQYGEEDSSSDECKLRNTPSNLDNDEPE